MWSIHSSFGGVVIQVAEVSLNALASLRSWRSRILVEGIYEQIVEGQTNIELALVEGYGRRSKNKSMVLGVACLRRKDKSSYVAAISLNNKQYWGISSGYQRSGCQDHPAFRKLGQARGETVTTV